MADGRRDDELADNYAGPQWRLLHGGRRADLKGKGGDRGSNELPWASPTSSHRLQTEQLLHHRRRHEEGAVLSYPYGGSWIPAWEQT